MLKAVIFDLDGVVADSHPIHEMAWRSLLVEAGLDPEAIKVDFLYAGHPRREILKHYLGVLSEAELGRWGSRKDELYELSAKKLQSKRGIPRVLSELHAAGIPCALATSAGRKRTLESLEHLGLTDFFQEVVTGEDVRNAKPAPDIFLLAARRLTVEPQNSVVVEDSVAGIRAAVAAGISSVGFTAPAHAEELHSAGADDVISEFPQDSVSYFESLVSRSDPSGLPLSAGRAKTSRQGQ
jgi:HAD superfamily hydrolase (TIGR01509 family)